MQKVCNFKAKVNIENSRLESKIEEMKNLLGKMNKKCGKKLKKQMNPKCNAKELAMMF